MEEIQINMVAVLVAVVANFILGFILSIDKDVKDVASVLNTTIFTWLGFYLPVDIGVVTWEKKSWKLFAINTGYHFMMLLVAAIILTHM